MKVAKFALIETPQSKAFFLIGVGVIFYLSRRMNRSIKTSKHSPSCGSVAEPKTARQPLAIMKTNPLSKTAEKAALPSGSGFFLQERASILVFA